MHSLQPCQLGNDSLLDFNARVSSGTGNSDVIGRFGETHTSANGQRLIQLLLGTNMYALNGRLPCMQPFFISILWEEETLHVGQSGNDSNTSRQIKETSRIFGHTARPTPGEAVSP